MRVDFPPILPNRSQREIYPQGSLYFFLKLAIRSRGCQSRDEWLCVLMLQKSKSALVLLTIAVNILMYFPPWHQFYVVLMSK